MRKSLVLLAVAVVLLGSCSKRCRCYRYDGDVEEFTDEELEAKDFTCEGMEQFDFGQVYSICEKTSL
ncbi:MAG: hypothetical protein IJM81_02335 [Prevotella sp.]|nr:hypothetical protein [Prevotella sp.]MBQ6956107.1 hypothetical protein [Bacteroidales bacterium]